MNQQLQQIATLLKQIETEISFRSPYSGKLQQIRDLVDWLENDQCRGNYQRFGSPDGLNLYQACYKVISDLHWSDQELLDAVIARHGLGQDFLNFDFAPTEQERQEEYQEIDIPDGCIWINYWTGQDTDLIAPESMFICALAEYLLQQNRSDLHQKLAQHYSLEKQTWLLDEKIQSAKELLAELKAELIFADLQASHPLIEKIDFQLVGENISPQTPLPRSDS